MSANLKLESMHSLARRSGDQSASFNAQGNLIAHYRGNVAEAGEEALATTLWRIVLKRKWTIAWFTLVVVATITAASLLMKPRYEAVSRVVFYREDQGSVLGF